MEQTFTLLTIISIITLGLLTFLKDNKNPRNRYFFAFTIIQGIWLLLLFYESEFKSILIAEILLKLDYMTAPFAALFFLLFCLNFPTVNHKINKIILPIALITLFFSLISGTNLVINNINFQNNILIYKMGQFYLLYAAYITTVLFIGIINLFIKYLSSHGKAKLQIFYVCLGLLLSSITLIIVNVFMQPAFSTTSQFSRIGIWGMLFFVVLTTYAMTKHQLLDIRIIINRYIAYILLITIYSLLSILLVYIYSIFYVLSFNVHSIIFIITLILIAGLSFHPLRLHIQTTPDKFLFRKKFEYSQAMKELNKSFTKTNNQNQVIEIFNNKINEVLEPSSFDIYFPN